jgi:hypothetical protein
MLRKLLWLVFSLFPALSFAAIFAARDLPDLPVWGLLLSVGVPVAVVEGVRSHWWITFVGLVAAHYCFFIVHPLFNRVVAGWKLKGAWAASNLLFYPIVPPIYALLCAGSVNSPTSGRHGLTTHSSGRSRTRAAERGR